MGVTLSVLAAILLASGGFGLIATYFNETDRKYRQGFLLTCGAILLCAGISILTYVCL